jgi:DNA processing protein
MNVAQAKAVAESVDATVLSLDDEAYPPLLRAIPDPPPLLFVRGDPQVLSQTQLAVVGSRRASPAGLRLAQVLSGALAQAGVHICSGLAAGVDGAAHRGALEGGGKSIAVMATGIDVVYPRRHHALADQVQRAGCLVTEFPPGTRPLRHHFPQRNRIISGLSLGVLVVEAALPSGSLITANTATQQGREVFALPWSMLHQGGRGCLQLIRDGAKMVLDIDDILEELGPLYALQQGQMKGFETVQPSAIDADAFWLLKLVGFEVTRLDDLVARSARSVAEVSSELSSLELAGKVERIPGGYIRC